MARKKISSPWRCMCTHCTLGYAYGFWSESTHVPNSAKTNNPGRSHCDFIVSNFGAVCRLGFDWKWICTISRLSPSSA